MRQKLAEFKKAVWSHYRAHKRDMPWRRDTSFYSIVVSEIMLQQTQVSRVAAKFDSWMKRFPAWEKLAKATTAQVLREWSGLGYNRRGLYLKKIAEAFASDPKRFAKLKEQARLLESSREKDLGRILYVVEELCRLPGIGLNTAGAILAYAFNTSTPFIETNIRSAYIHFFFPGRKKVSDRQILPLIEETMADPLVRKNAREWHWALMDYGSHLKSIAPNPSRRSAHHVRQKPFKGSNRELRSLILKSVMNGTPLPAGYPAAGIRRNLAALAKEGFIVKKPGRKGRAASVYEIA